jgi:hypothetical protein
MSTQSRAQGTTTIPWPSKVSETPTTCCVALRVQITQDRVGRDVEILHEVPRVALGEPQATLRALMDERDLQLQDALRTAVLEEIGAIGTIDPSCPILLARLEECDGGRCVCVEALILPVSHERAAELRQLQADEDDPEVSHGLGWLWAQEIEVYWRGAAPNGRLPVRYLEDVFVRSSDRRRDAAAVPHDPGPTAGLVAA